MATQILKKIQEHFKNKILVLKNKNRKIKSLKLNIKVVQYTMYLKQKTCNTKIFIELKNSRTFKNQGWKNTIFQEQFKTKMREEYQGLKSLNVLEFYLFDESDTY